MNESRLFPFLSSRFFSLGLCRLALWNNDFSFGHRFTIRHRDLHRRGLETIIDKCTGMLTIAEPP
jgi:hypothetical protein